MQENQNSTTYHFKQPVVIEKQDVDDMFAAAIILCQILGAKSITLKEQERINYAEKILGKAISNYKSYTNGTKTI